MKKKVSAVLTLLIALFVAYQQQGGLQSSTSTQETQPGSIIASAYRNHQSNVQVQGKGRVIRVLADDNKGSRHQKFIVKLASGQKVLIVHNIDLAPRLKGLGKGDEVEFYGEYEWNDKGGLVHWTHKDPEGRHIDGWLEYGGQMYQ
ncbi:MAG: DUF3465 domain-containing protein [bacterium]